MRLVTPATLSLLAVAFAASPPWLPAQQPAQQGATVEARPAAMLPISTASAAAREHLLQGQRALDMQRAIDAVPHFRAAVAADSSFAFAYLQLANASSSLEEYRTNVQRAVRLASRTTEAERLQIQMADLSLKSDVEGQLALARRLTSAQPRNPRSWTILAGVQSGLGRELEARQSLRRAVMLAPDFAPAHLLLGASYTGVEPRDFTRADRSIRRAIVLEPKEPAPYDLLGDLQRATGRLAQARDSYTRAAELAPSNALLRQQRGHVHSLLGRLVAARADYDSAIAIGRDNEKAEYAVYRALVHVHGGDNRAAVEELDRLVGSIDGLGIPDPDGQKVFALTEQALIAIHSGMPVVAATALERRAALLRKEIAAVNRDEFRRTTEADIAYWDGMLAARKGDYATATAKAQEAMKLVAPTRNPRRDERAHELLGYVSLFQGKHADALAHFKQADPNDVYVTHHRALALEGAGLKREARALFSTVARHGFNSARSALVRADAKRRAG